MWCMKIFQVLRQCGFLEYGKVTDTGTYALFGEKMILQKMIINSFFKLYFCQGVKFTNARVHTKRV